MIMQDYKNHDFSEKENVVSEIKKSLTFIGAMALLAVLYLLVAA